MAPQKNLSLSSAKSDVENLKTRNIDLAGLLPPLGQNDAPVDDDSLVRSRDFAQSARIALQTASSGDIDDTGARVESIRDSLDAVIQDLDSKRS
ncbi:hypothetical protein DL93DRAFT_2166512 [Clavulina sp. PMI_390]|nr:hypothetical protein DL93DRAFT_2166512 [Clavulina sp. PMI_390]